MKKQAYTSMKHRNSWGRGIRCARFARRCGAGPLVVLRTHITAWDRGNLSMTNVLIVEDAMELAEAIEAMLCERGLTVFTTTHGEDGIALIESEQPELIILDLELPDMDGWEVLETIQERRRVQEPTVIVTTAYGDVTNRLMGCLQGVYRYLVKPFALEQVEQAVVDALGLESS